MLLPFVVKCSIFTLSKAYDSGAEPTQKNDLPAQVKAGAKLRKAHRVGNQKIEMMSNPYLLATSWTSFTTTGSSYSPINDQGSRADGSVIFWLPSGLSSQQYYLGMIACSVQNYNSSTPPTGTFTYVFSLENDDPTNSLLARPTGFTPLWTCVGNDQPSNLGIYTIDGPPGYLGLGCIAVSNFNSPPQVSDYPQLMCVRGDLVTFDYTVSSNIWTDQGSGAPLDVSIWQSPLSNIALAYLNKGYPNSQQVSDLSRVYTG